MDDRASLVCHSLKPVPDRFRKRDSHLPNVESRGSRKEHGVLLGQERQAFFFWLVNTVSKTIWRSHWGNFILSNQFIFRGGHIMNRRWYFGALMVMALVLGTMNTGRSAEVLFKDYDVVIVEDLKVPTGSPAPESSGVQMAEKAVYQLSRYSQKYKLFETVVKEGGKVQEIPAGKKVLVIKGEVKEYTRESVGRRIGRSFLPGGEFTGTAAFAAHYQFIDKASGKVIYETDLRTGATGSNDSVEYAMDRNGEALAKLITKYKGK